MRVAVVKQSSVSNGAICLQWLYRNDSDRNSSVTAINELGAIKSILAGTRGKLRTKLCGQALPESKNPFAVDFIQCEADCEIRTHQSVETISTIAINLKHLIG